VQQTAAIQPATTVPPAAGRRQPRLLDRLREALRAHGYTLRAEQAYVSWAERYIRFHGLRHPGDLGEAEVKAFLSHLVHDLGVSPTLKSQAFAALLFLYREVLGRQLDWIDGVARARRPQRRPAGVERDLVRSLLEQLGGPL
jgi:hypothetical protein